MARFFDSLLVKVTARGRTFAEATARLLRAVGEVRVRGVKTNLAFLRRVLTHPTFVRGACWTTFVDDTPALFRPGGHGAPAEVDRLLHYLGDLVVNGGPADDADGAAATGPAATTTAPPPRPPLQQALVRRPPSAVLSGLYSPLLAR